MSSTTYTNLPTPDLYKNLQTPTTTMTSASINSLDRDNVYLPLIDPMYDVPYYNFLYLVPGFFSIYEIFVYA